VQVCLADARAEGYDYPFVNPYEATVIGTPEMYQKVLQDKIRLKNLQLTIFKNRHIPDVFWYHQKLRCSLAYQNKKAPLIINIAGTGAGHDSMKMKAMEKAFFNAGFHVLSLPSPTHANFIVTASTSMVPGYIEQDARDLYRVMALAWDKIKTDIEVSEFYLTGYSLGAAQSAFVSKLDEEKKLFGFKKVLMINPPVNLFNSVQRLDQMLEDNIPGGLDHFDAFFDKVFQKISEYYSEENQIDLTDPDFLYELYKKSPPKESGLAALIGTSFRFSSSNMIFTSDVMVKGGFIVPANLELSPYTSLTDYGVVTFRTSFTDYFHELFYPYFKAKDPGLTKKEIIKRVSLESIGEYLKKTKKIGLVGNEDDLILAPGEVEFLRRIFNSRAVIYPNGGHCGNIEHQSNVAYMTNFFKK
jgi:pimeloyl-ACP methyl ester carboxylesterase